MPRGAEHSSRTPAGPRSAHRQRSSCQFALPVATQATPFSYRTRHRGRSQDPETLQTLSAKMSLWFYPFVSRCGPSEHVSQWSSANVVLGFVPKVAVPEGWCSTCRPGRVHLAGSAWSRSLHLFVFPAPPSPASCIQTRNVSWRGRCVYFRAGATQMSMRRKDGENSDTAAATHVVR